jgi:hypothetical protein
MKVPTSGQKRWFWFAALWCAGLAATSVLAYATRWLIASV